MTDSLNDTQKALVQKNLDLAHFLAREAWKRNKEEMELEDVVSVAYHGLIKAALRFDPSRMTPETVENGKAFSGFARQKINGAILDWQREIDHVQRTYRQWYKQLQKSGYVPHETPRKEVRILADKLGLEVEKALLIIRSVESRDISINLEPTMLGMEITEGALSGNAMTWRDRSDKDLESDAVGAQITHAAQDAFNRLPDTQKTIIALRYFSHDEFQVIAADMSLSLAAVRDAHAEAVFSIHRAMRQAATETV